LGELKALEKNIYPKRFDEIKLTPLTQRKKIKWVNIGDVTAQLPEWSRARLRFHLKDIQVVEIPDEPQKTIAYGLYREALRNAGHQRLIDKFELDQRVQDWTILKNLSEYMKKKGTEADPHWRYLVDLHRLNDYIKPPELSEFAEDIRDWVQRKPVHTWNGDEEKWYSIFRESMRKVLFRSGSKPDKIISVDDFVKNGDLWATSGSGFEPDAEKLTVVDKLREVEVEVKKNKWSVRWGLSNYKVKRLLFKKRKQMCKGVPKSEPAKVRAVISSDLGLYLKMTYISTFLEQILKGRTDSTLWMSAEDRNQLWQKMAPDGTWRMPLDQSEFDKNQTKRQVMITLDIIKELIATYGAPDDMLEIMDLIIYALDGGYVLVDGTRIDITNGVLSGWRWTALIDTLINLTELEMAQRWVHENSAIRVDLKDFNAQGDDDWLKIGSYRAAIALWLAYESFGLFVNPGKFFLDKWRDEYLRRVMDNNKVTGYPARSVASIVFRDPTSPKEPIGEGRIRSSFGKWKLFAERFDVVFKTSWFYKKFLQDSVQGVRGITKSQVNDWVNLSAIYGGLGLDNDGFRDCLIPPTSSLEVHNLEIKGDGYTEWAEFASTFGVEEKTANTFAVSTLDVEGRFRIPRWIKYIYTYDVLSTGFPHGTELSLSGTVAMGYAARAMARIKGWRWYKDMQQLTHLSSWSESEYTQSELIPGLIRNIHLPKGRVRAPRLDLVDGITLTLAQLSTTPELVYKNYDESQLSHLPRSWKQDYLRGKLKNRSGPISGWGLDVSGYMSQRLLGAAIVIFLSTSKPTILLWKSLLASIDAALPVVLQGLKITVVE